MEKVDFMDYRNTFVGRFIIKAISSPKLKIVKEVIANRPDKGSDDWVLTINGVEVPFIKTLEAFEEYLDEAVLHKANELLAEKSAEINDILDDALDDAFEQAKAVLKI